ncbi:MAG: helix-turn-helix domain-containing protein [Planctomycetes bacterium]|nr:helix-turn-helix domain-containing protein [Planctomycetota bacterium]
MPDPDRSAFVPAVQLSTNPNKNVSSYELFKFIECIHLVRQRLSCSEACVLHCLVMRGWSKGHFRVSQAFWALQTGLTVRTVQKVLKTFEDEGLIRRTPRRGGAMQTELTECATVEEAVFLFQNDTERTRRTDEFVTKAWAKRLTNQANEPGTESDSATE